MPTIGLPGGAADPTGPLQTAVLTAVADGAREVLRIASGDPDAPRVDDAADSAIRLVEQYLDRADDPFVGAMPDPVLRACVIVTIELFRRKDAPFGVLNSWSDSDVGPVRIGTDPLKGVEQLLMPYSHRYGVG
jgi:hypothetical protein